MPFSVFGVSCELVRFEEIHRVHSFLVLPCPPLGAVTCALALVALGIFALLIHDRALNGSLPAFPIGEAEIGSHTSGVGKMNHNIVRALAAGMMSVGIATVSANARSAVQWRVEDGGNGHWYRTVPRDNRNWIDCVQIATNVGGHLGTLTTPLETAFVVAQILDGAHAALGDFQSSLDPNFSEPAGGWVWITGEPWIYTNWAPCRCERPEPNDWSIYGHEDWLTAYSDGLWNDGPYNIWWTTAILIEWSADCNNDSIIDYGQILAGELEDLNANNIPDCCEGGVPCSCPADLDGNGEVNSIDLAIILDKFGTDGGKDYPNADIDDSGIVDAADLTAILSGWGACQ